MGILRYLKALRRCAAQCFNANQVTQHEHKWLQDAVTEEQAAWAALPSWVRRLLNKVAG
jgi:hypothetical protein